MSKAGEPLEKPDYVVNIEYDVVEGIHVFRSRLSRSILVSGSWDGGLDDEGDDVGDANYEVRWGFRVIKSGEAKPVFKSIFREESLQMWSFDVEQWMERYFSE